MYFEHPVCLELHFGATMKRKIEFLTSRNSQSREAGRTSFNQGSFGYKKQKPIKLVQEMKGAGAILRRPGGALLRNPRQEHGRPRGPESPQEARPRSTSPKPQGVPRLSSFCLSGLSASSASQRALALFVLYVTSTATGPDALP